MKPFVSAPGWSIAALVIYGSFGAAYAQPAADPASAPAVPSDAPSTAPNGPSQDGDTETSLADDANVSAKAANTTTPSEKSLDEVLEGLDHTGSAPLPPKVTPTPEGTTGPKAPPHGTRETPNYEGRDSEAAGAGDVLIWVPRVVLFPVHLTLNWLVRKPIVWLITRAEANYFFTRVEKALTFFDGKATLFPTFLADFGLNPAAGLTYTHSDLFADSNTFNLSVAMWNPRDWLRVAIRNEQLTFSDDTGLIVLDGEFLRRPDQVYYGIGADTRTDDERIYAIERGEVGLELFATLAGLNKISFSTRFRIVEFDSEGARRPAIGRQNNLDGVPLERPGAIAFSTPDTIPGFDERYQLLEHRIHIMLDSRSPDTQFDGGTGLRFEAFGSFEWDPQQTSRSFFRVGGELSAFYDFSDKGHVAGLRAYTEFLIDDIGDDDVPFTELPQMGGPEIMRGYLPGRFIGKYAVALTGTYRYPVWSLLDAEVFGSIGNAFGTPDEVNDVEITGDGSQRFSFNHLYAAGGIGLRTNLDRDVALSILFGLGTNRFDSEDFGIDSIRFTFGVTQGF